MCETRDTQEKRKFLKVNPLTLDASKTSLCEIKIIVRFDSDR